MGVRVCIGLALLVAGIAFTFREFGTPATPAAESPARPLAARAIDTREGLRRGDAPASSPALTSEAPGSFGERVRCAQYRRWVGQRLPRDAAKLLCDRRPLDAVALLTSMAEAGEPRARVALAVLGRVGTACEVQKLSPAAAATMLRRAEEQGETGETVRRLREVLAAEQAGPGLDDLEACRRSAAAFQRLRPAMLEEVASTLGRPIKALRGENAADVEIEYERKMLVPGDADGEYQLALALLQKRTAGSEAEAAALLRQAAQTLPGAKSELAKCLLKGCPTPAADPAEAHQLLADAALAGDPAALGMLSGATDPKSFDPSSILSAAEQYAWSQFRRRLNEEGCFGTSDFIGWAALPQEMPNLLAMSPLDSAAAQARAAALLASSLGPTRALLGCD